MHRRLVILALLAFAAPAPSLAADKASPEAFVQDFYRREQLPVKRGELRAAFVADLAAAIGKEYGKDEPGELDFDYRYGAQDFELKDLRLSTSPLPSGALVTARFTSFGKPFEIRYRLAPAKGGWRFADISAPAQNDDTPWSLRAKLGLSPAP